MNDVKDQVQTILQEMPHYQTFILRDILEAEKRLIHRENLQGSNIINDIVNIIKERVTLD